jgi:hypothetical protein
VICNLASACACRRLLLRCATPLADGQTGALAHGSLVRLGIPVLLGSLSNERPAALDPDRATGPWVSLISPESPLVVVECFRKTFGQPDSHHDETHAQSLPITRTKHHHKASPMLIADLFPLQCLQCLQPKTQNPKPPQRGSLSAVELHSVVHSPGTTLIL